jgi:hypothetical protein
VSSAAAPQRKTTHRHHEILLQQVRQPQYMVGDAFFFLDADAQSLEGGK